MKIASPNWALPFIFHPSNSMDDLQPSNEPMKSKSRNQMLEIMTMNEYYKKKRDEATNQEN